MRFNIPVLSLLSLLILASPAAVAVEAVVHISRGEVQYSAPDSDVFHSLKKGMRLPEGSKIRTGEDGLAVLRLTTGSAVRVARDTEVVLDILRETGGKGEGQQQVKLKLNEGAVSSLIKKENKEKSDFKIETPQGSAAARGTFYAVGIEEGKTYVKVAEGEVGVEMSEALDTSIADK